MLSQTKLQDIPGQPGIYIFKDHRGQILYIGKAKNLNKRVHQYFAVGSVWKQDMMHKADSVEFMIVDNEGEALILESNLIKQHQPAYNRLLKGDNSYVYIKITAEPRPQIFFTRTRSNDGAIYIGPKHMRRELTKLLQYLRQLLGYRGCKSTQFKQGKLCSDYLFGICRGRCVYEKLKVKNGKLSDSESLKREKTKSDKGKTSEQLSSTSKYEETSPSVHNGGGTINPYLADAMKLGFPADTTFQSGRQQSRYMIQLIVDFFHGETDKILTHVTQEIESCIVSQNFEYAAKLRDIYHNLDALTQKQSVIIDPQIHGHYCLIQQLGSYRVYCILTIQHGKLVDLLRFKESVEDVNMEQIILQIEMEYGSSEDGVIKIEHTTDKYHDIRIGRHIKHGVLDLAPLTEHALRAIESFVISDSWQSNSVVNDLLSQLQSRYQLSQYPYRVECIDISHLSGGWASGGLSCMVGGMPNKKLYRQYKIPKSIAGDDLASLTHVLVSRFKLGSQEVLGDDQLPDMFIIDGAAPQLKLIDSLIVQYPVLASYANKIQFCSIAKGEARSSTSKLYGAAEQLMIRSDYEIITTHALVHDPVDQIITKLRDEAHRFANRYRTKQMSMEIRE